MYYLIKPRHTFLVILLFVLGLQAAYSQAPPLAVLKGEYFFDTDPGKGNGNAFSNLSGDAITNLVQNGINSLPPGNHTINVRVMGIDNNWSPTFTTVIYTDTVVTNNPSPLQVLMGEYFFDTDPGQGNGTAFLGLSGDAITNLIKKGINSLTPGAHTVNVRVMGLDSKWSPVYSNVIYTDTIITNNPLPLQVIKGEYFFDTDPGQGNGTSFLGLSGDAITNVIKNGISSLSPGAHTVNVRIMGLDGNWSPVYSNVIYTDTITTNLPSPLQLVQAEYFFDTDPGQGNGTPMYTVSGQFNDAVEQLAANPNTGSLDTGLHRFSMRVKGIDGYWSPVYSVVVYILPCSPAPSVSITPSTQQTICSGDSVVFNASASGTGIQYQWRKNDINISGATSLAYHAKSPGIYDLSVINSSGCGIGSNIDSVKLSTSAITPVVTIVANTGSNVCVNANVTFNATPTGGGATPSYQWYLNSTKVGTNNASYSNSTLNNNDKVYCIMTSSASCVTSPTATSSTITMSVNAYVTPSVSIAVGPRDSICTGSFVQFTATPSYGGNQPAYQWEVNSQVVGTNSNIYSSSSLKDHDVITCLFTSNASCITKTTATSNVITETVLPYVIPSVTISSNVGNSICVGNGALFTAVPVQGGTKPSYQWKVNSKTVGTSGATYTDNSISNGDTISCIMTSNALCTTTSTGTSNTIVMTVSNSFTPTIVISVADTNVCAGDSVTFTAAINGGGNSPVIQWTLNGANAGTNANTFVTNSLNDGDVVGCKLTSNSPCATIQNVTSNNIKMKVNSLPNPPAINQSGDTLISTPAASYQWYFASNAIINATSRQLMADQNGNYQVEITDANGCKNKSAAYDVINTGITSKENEVQINIYPNPNSGVFVLEADFGNSGPVDISLVNTLGEMVMKIESGNLKGRYSRQVDITNLPAGVYFLKIESSNTTACRRLVKM